MSGEPTVVVIQGASEQGDVPGIDALGAEAVLRFAPDAESLAAVLPGAEVLLGWDFRARLEDAWDRVDRLRWVHWCGAGVDAALFPALARSDVVLTNARGIFDAAMAEYALGLVLAFAKRLPETVRFQMRGEWRYRLTERIAGSAALVVGAGSIGRAIARQLRAAGLSVSGVGRRARSGDADFGEVHASADLRRVLPTADWVLLVAPLTPETRGIIGAAELDCMKATARLVNLGRGQLVDETALITALEAGTIAGAALDVFREEPLPESSPLWAMDRVIVSPHMSGDFEGFQAALAAQFMENFRRWRAGDPLANVVDKRAGFATA